VTRHRLNIFLEREHALRLGELATMKRLSKSSLVAAALATYLSPDQADRQAMTLRRLEKLSKQLERVERDQSILIETLALFIRHHFAITAPVAETHQEAARAQSRLRFSQFIEQLARHLQRGGSLVKDLSQEFEPVGPAAGGEGRPA
jgi:uncharacterized membrane-anchored protein YhcB (DUF1043 family)